MKPKLAPIDFDPHGLFAQVQVEISIPPGKQFPECLPKSFRLLPEVRDGNIQLTVDKVEYAHPPENPPIWRVENSVLNPKGQMTISMRDSLNNLLLLTGVADAGTAEGSAIFAPSQGEQSIATWQAKQLPENSSFRSEFSWTFLLAEDNEAPISVILEFEILVGKKGALSQLSSIPPNWNATGFALKDGLLFTLTGPNKEQYCLMQGLFAGALGALVCQGTMSVGAACQQKLKEGQGDGTWTGTSGGPI